ncbi:MAG TPA: hypothetical protein VE978_21870 [Chitinophagales bacterium]|nr:hypothetical protein [Chitinophagales bacterium]
MIWTIPFLNALFGWSIIALLFRFLFHPYRKKNFFIFEMQGFIPKNFSIWSEQLGDYVSEHVVNIPKMKESLLQGEKLKQIHNMLEEKVDDFLRNKLKEKIPVFSMFITEGLISKMKEILVAELEQMVPALIEQIASGVEEQFNVKKMINDKVNAVSMNDLEKLFYQYAGKSILALQISVAALGLLLGAIEILLMKM